MIYSHEKVQRIKTQYPPGTRIQLQSMSGETDMLPGIIGTVDFVDDIGQLQMTWDNGRTLALIPGEDIFTVISQPKHEPCADGSNLGYVLDEQWQEKPHAMEHFQATMEYKGCNRLNFVLDISQSLHCYDFLPYAAAVIEHGKKPQSKTGWFIPVQ